MVAAEAPAEVFSEADRDRILATLKEMTDRPRCNRIMGCHGAVVLASYGPAVAEPLADILDKNPRADGYWYFELIRLLGQLGSPRALTTLHTLLQDSVRWEVPIRAAQALGHLASATSRAPLEAALARATAGDDVALQAAAHGALARVDPAQASTHRAALVALVPRDAEGIAAIPPVILDILIEEVQMTRVPEALPGVRLAALHDNRFVRAQALDTLARLHDTGGIPYALDRLDDTLPSIRKKALVALQEITGIRTMTDPDEWRRWCERNNLAKLPE